MANAKDEKNTPVDVFAGMLNKNNMQEALAIDPPHKTTASQPARGRMLPCVTAARAERRGVGRLGGWLGYGLAMKQASWD